MVTRDDKKLLALRDPSGISEAVATLSPELVAVVEMFDGASTRDQICQRFAEKRLGVLDRATLDHLIGELDRALLLDSDHFREHAARQMSDFMMSDIRPAAFAGRSYPADAQELSASLDAAFAPPLGPGSIDPAIDPGEGVLPRAIVAPHIDFHRGAPSYAWAYRPLMMSTQTPDRIVIFGTNHNGLEPFAFTRKRYQSPLGQFETDVAFVDAIEYRVRAELGSDAAQSLFSDEIHHRSEHSIEFQTVWLSHVLGDRARDVKLVPILCGSFHEFVSGNRSLTESRLVALVLSEVARLSSDQTLLVAGADLAHVGPRFGDGKPFGALEKINLEARDRQTMTALATGHAQSWFAEIQSEADARRVCGLSPIYSMLAAAQPPLEHGALVSYAQCPADDENASWVSIASMIFPAIFPAK